MLQMKSGKERAQEQNLSRRMRDAYQRLEGLLGRDSRAGMSGPTAPQEALEKMAVTVEELRVVSEQLRQQNQALAEAGRRYQELFQYAPDAHVRTDTAGVIQEANRAAARLLHVPQAFLVGKPLFLFIVHERRGQFYAQMDALLERGGPKRWRTRLRPRPSTQGTDDEPFEVDISMSALRDGTGQATGIQWAIREAIEEGEAQQREPSRSGRHAEDLMVVNQVSRELSATLDVEAATERLLREVTQAIDAEGASVWLWDKREGDHLLCRALVHGGERLPSDDLRLERGQGVAGWAAENGESVVIPCSAEDDRFFSGIDAQTGLSTNSLLAVPLEVHGKALGVVEVVNKSGDVFSAADLFLIETLAASAAIAIHNAQLIAELEARNGDLAAFAHTVAHDINSTLGLVVGYADALAFNLDSLPREELRSHLQTVRKQGHRISRIVDELLLLAEVREADAAREPLDMASILADVLDRLGSKVEENGAEIEMPETWPVALGYGPWIEEVWVNYLSNALKYGGRPPHVELGAEQVDEGVRFWVQDGGPGIPPEKRKDLFRPFTERSSIKEGHGLGLSIVRRIVEKLGGEVGVDNTPGHGATFWFTLPAASET